MFRESDRMVRNLHLIAARQALREAFWQLSKVESDFDYDPEIGSVESFIADAIAELEDIIDA